MASWQPAPESLQQLAVCLKDSLSGFNKEAQKKADLMLQQAKSSPDINNYLAYLFSSPIPPAGLDINQNDYHLVRSAAAIMMKNNVRSSFKQISDESLSLMKVAIPLGLQDKNSTVRNYAGNIATEIIRRGGILAWPDLIPQLLTMVDGGAQSTSEAQEGAMATLAKICEDNTRLLEREHNGERPLNFLLPKLIQATKSPSARVRAQALTAINVFVPRRNQAMLNSVDDLLQHLFFLSSDDNLDVRRQVCKAFVQLVNTRADKLQPHIAGLVDYIISQHKSDDEDLACEASEFWLAVGEHDNLWQSLAPYIQKIIPVLLESMVYSPEDIALLGSASDDEDEEDREEDIKPVFAKKGAARSAAAAAQGDASADSSQNGNAYEKLASMDADVEEGEIEEDDEGDEDPEEKWNLRKASAAALDVFARDFRGPVFECIMPYLEQNLRHEEWPHREAAVLALGAIADGCLEVVAPHLPDLIPYLLSLLNDEEPVVRQITCWTLGRYSLWAADTSDPERNSRYFVPLMEGILHKMLDKNKKVQEAGASAFANVAEKTQRKLEPYALPIIKQFVLCFARYKDRNIFILYDCVQTLAEHLGPVLARPDLVAELMPALIGRYHKVSDQSRELFPLLECLSYVATALGDAFTPYAQPIFHRCVNIIHINLEQSLAAVGNPALDNPDKDFLVTSLDLLSAIIQALGETKALALVKEAQGSFFELMSFCMEDPANEVRQSAYALLGDCAKYVYPILQQYLSSIMPILLKQLDFENVLDEEVEDGFNVVNNACWAAGETSLQHGKAMTPYTGELMQRFVEIMTNPRVPPAVVENAAIALGRLGLENSEILAPALPTFAEEFLNAMEDVDASDEKATAFKGFTMIVAQNPQAMEKTLVLYFGAIARYQDLDLENPLKENLRQIFQNVIDVYRQIIPQFHEFLGRLSQADLQALKSKYVL